MEEARAKKRQRREVVSEEVYSSTLSTIIQRDYFSDLPQLQLKAAVLARREARDVAGAVAVRRAARKIQNHEESLDELEEQEESDTTDDGLRKTARPLERESLTGFHNRVTSEDNAEFQQNQQQEVQANRQRLEALFQSSNKEQQLLLKEKGEEGEKYPALASDEFNPPSSRIEFSKWKKPSARNGLFFVPNPTTINGSQMVNDQVKLLPSSCPDDSKKPSSISEEDDNSIGKTTALMPPPSKNHNQSIISSVPTISKHALVEYIPKNRIKKKIEPSQTRFPSTINNSNLLALRTTAIGSPGDESSTSYATDASTDLESDGRSLASERRARARRKERENQTFVSMTPLVVPGGGSNNDDAAVEASPIITWGTVAATPLLVSKNDDSDEQLEVNNTETSRFSLAEESGREIAAQKAAMSLEKRSARLRESTKKSSRGTNDNKKNDKRSVLRGKSSSSGRRDISSFSPAALSLLAKTTKSNQNPLSARSSSSLGSALRRSTYTPQRGRISTSTSTSTSRLRDSSSFKATPRVTAAASGSNGCKEAQAAKAAMQNKKKQSSSITAGLLDL